MPLGGGVQRGDLVFQHGIGQVVPDRAVPVRAAARGAAAVRHQDREALLGQPLRGVERALGGQHPLRMRAAVRVEQHRQPGRARPVPGRQQQGAADLLRAGREQIRLRGRQAGLLGADLDVRRAGRCPGVLENLDRGPRVGQGAADQDGGAAGPGAAVYAAGRAEMLRAGPFAVEPQADLGWVVPGRGEQHGVPVGAEDVPDLEGGRGDRAGGARSGARPRCRAAGGARRRRRPSRRSGRRWSWRAPRARCPATSGRCPRGSAWSPRWPGRPGAAASGAGPGSAPRAAARPRLSSPSPAQLTVAR